MWVLILTEHNGRYPAGYFVARKGSRASYTAALQKAETWTTREEAAANACPDNERPVSVSEVMNR